MRLLLLTGALVLAFSATAHACSCASPSGDPEAEIAESDAAVYGKVVKRTQKGERMIGDVVYKLRVLKDYKGNAGRFLRFRTAGSSAACGLYERKGGRLAVLLHRSGGSYQGTLCGVRTKRYLDGNATAARTSRALCRKSKRQGRTAR